MKNESKTAFDNESKTAFENESKTTMSSLHSALHFRVLRTDFTMYHGNSLLRMNLKRQ